MDDARPEGLDFALLERLAREASPGPWHDFEDGTVRADAARHVAVMGCPEDGATMEDLRNGAFVAAWNPATALAVLAERTRLEAALRDALSLLDATSHPGDTAEDRRMKALWDADIAAARAALGDRP